jgi:hypothetical protein
MRVIQLNHIEQKHDSHIFICDDFRGATQLYEKLKKSDVFAAVIFLEKSGLGRSKYYKLRSLLINSFRIIRHMKKYKYDRVITCNYNAPTTNTIMFKTSRQNNPQSKFIYMEDGPNIYLLPIIRKARFIRFVFGKFAPQEDFDEFWHSCPERMSFPSNAPSYKLPAINTDDGHLISILNNVFSFDLEAIDIREKIIFMEESFFAERLVEDEDIKLFSSISQSFKNKKCVAKLHPRSFINRFPEYIPVIHENGIPWEIIALNNKNSDLTLVSISCGTLASSKLLLNIEFNVVWLYPLFQEIIRDKNGLLTIDKKAIMKIRDIEDLYEDKRKCAVLYNENEVVRYFSAMQNVG